LAKEGTVRPLNCVLERGAADVRRGFAKSQDLGTALRQRPVISRAEGRVPPETAHTSWIRIAIEEKPLRGNIRTVALLGGKGAGKRDSEKVGGGALLFSLHLLEEKELCSLYIKRKEKQGRRSPNSFSRPSIGERNGVRGLYTVLFS